ncbi:hypothetical protein BHF71_10750 [Vulcanibacillus modesticaldus]|uniref:N-acetyltransferase domain-containing protein n=1 Tax=Vulcanibacillus modesticaldus TaxID=337097 RepID=A0A1D2YT41_9BACI|nr:GNAT family N-acetyltransferase [Vulcanibacillus modesticaldus]OEF98835.1 hypothetical protein BHF71_10750 [Vulcanibacillus modesticaldus]
MGYIKEREYNFKTGEKLLIRTALPNDIKGILAISKEVMKEGKFFLTTYEEFKLNEENGSKWVQSYYENPQNIIIVAELSGEIIGSLDFFSGTKKRIAHQGSFAMSVKKEWRSQGIGKLLLETLISWAKENTNLEKICLEVLSTNIPAIKLYKRFGFTEEGRRIKQVKMDDREYDDLIYMGLFI